MANPDLVELRGEIDRDLIDVLDAVAQAEASNRMTVLRRWIRERADSEIHRAMMIMRVRRGKGSESE